MCVLTALLAYTVTVSSTVHIAEYSRQGIRINPTVCELPIESQLFALYHEEAHGLFSHLDRAKVEGVKKVESEADQYAIDRLKQEGYDACKAVQFALPSRGFYSTTHPNMFSLNRMACGD